MKLPDSTLVAATSLANRRIVSDWAKARYRDRVFEKDQPIPTRQGLLYLVNKGVVRMIGSNKMLSLSHYKGSSPPQAQFALLPKTSNLQSEIDEDSKDTFLGFIGAGQPFEIISDANYDLKAYAHIEDTEVIWLYWQDLDNWLDIRQQVYETFRYQHQRKLRWLSTLGQRRTMDRLRGFLALLIEEHGKPCREGYYLPYNLTHAQISSSIGSTRVTVTRLMGELRRQGKIKVLADNSLCIPSA